MRELNLRGQGLDQAIAAPRFSAKGGEIELEELPSRGIQERLRGQGWPRKDGSRGDLYVRLNVTVPATPSDEEKELYRKLRELQK